MPKSFLRLFSRVTAPAEMRSDFFVLHTSYVFSAASSVQRLWCSVFFGEDKNGSHLYAAKAIFAAFVAALAANIPFNRQILPPIRMMT
jgi:hypothetical protein